MIVSGKKTVFTALVLIIFCPVVFCGDNNPNELVLNPTFEQSESGNVPSHWSVWRPVWEKSSCNVKAVTGEKPK